MNFWNISVGDKV